MSLGPIASIAVEEKWISLRLVSWNVLQPTKYTFKGRVRKSGELYINVPDRIVTDEFYGEYILL